MVLNDYKAPIATTGASDNWDFHASITNVNNYMPYGILIDNETYSKGDDPRYGSGGYDYKNIFKLSYIWEKRGYNMYANINLNIDELDLEFIQNLQKTFKGKSIEIVITDNSETDYLLSNDNNKDVLLSRIKDFNDSKNLVEFDLNE